MWKAVSQEDKIEKARNDCILNVAAYVKANPRARPMEIQKKVQDEIEIFKVKIQWSEKIIGYQCATACFCMLPDLKYYTEFRFYRYQIIICRPLLLPDLVYLCI